MLTERVTTSPHEYQEFLKACLDEALKACRPAYIVPPHLPDLSAHKGRVVVIGAGKASAAMAAALESHYGPDTALEGVVVTRYGYGAPTDKIKIIEAAHPVPDAHGQGAATEILNAVNELTENDLVIALISGGGSALMPCPAHGISLEDKRAINKALLSCGAPIDEMNCVRKHISAIKGGQLARTAYPAQVLSLIISDVPDNDPSVVASGPTCPDPTTQKDALAIIERYGIQVPDRVWTHLQDARNETPKPDDPLFARAETKMIARGLDALNAAAAYAESQGFEVLNLGDALEGEARDVARDMIRMIKTTAQHRTKPLLVLSGGETTITLKGMGAGGRNQEFALAAMIEAAGNPHLYGLAADTDGIDGNRDIAGALFTPQTLPLAQAKGVSPEEYLEDNNSYTFFEQLEGHLIDTGPTLTNVNDFRAILWLP
ncbi:MAG: glycerate kinase [Alphaproteobacteria bacterium]|nr:glycerate kinase [Alphaproteobacteria bacterium]MCD8520487.1 glycerate kinase [Alphaproteobacteria bacterium]MCD8571177.1 glycerate kinase [Alphaproteobacteria bacterium]